MISTKPGYLTTEFWVTIISHVVALVALFDPSINAGAWTQPLAVLAAGLASAVYAASRAHVKRGAIASAAAAALEHGLGSVLSTTTVSPAPAVVTTPAVVSSP